MPANRKRDRTLQVQSLEITNIYVDQETLKHSHMVPTSPECHSLTVFPIEILSAVASCDFCDVGRETSVFVGQ
jgi:hypothetical protein